MFIIKSKNKNNTRYLKRDLVISAVAGLFVGLLIWSVGSSILQTVHASSLTSVSDTLTDSRPGFPATSTIVYTNPSSTTAGQTISYTFDPNASAFGSVTSTSPTTATSTGMLIATSTCPGSGSYVTMATTSYNVLTFTVCPSNTIASGTITLKVPNIVNPTSTGSYIIRIGGTQSNSADTRVAITNGISVTASVATTFTFVVAGLPTSTLLGNGATTTGSTVPSSSTLPFGTLAPNTHNELAQQLYVTTNASNGFAVTVHDEPGHDKQQGKYHPSFQERQRDLNAESVDVADQRHQSIVDVRSYRCDER